MVLVIVVRQGRGDAEDGDNQNIDTASLPL